jgi:hypothetical protein
VPRRTESVSAALAGLAYGTLASSHRDMSTVS